jgi:hypothetical protein
MARKLKTYQTSLGFFDQAIAAPSMKAALEAWGADSNLFHQGAAKESNDPDVIAATTARPGVVLKRPVGSNGPFRENAGLPTKLGNERSRATKAAPKASKKATVRPVDKASEWKAAAAYERELKRREREQAREEAAKKKHRERRQQAIDKATAALDRAEEEHARRADALRAELEAVEMKVKAQEADWDKEQKRLKDALRRARD